MIVQYNKCPYCDKECDEIEEIISIDRKDGHLHTVGSLYCPNCNRDLDSSDYINDHYEKEIKVN